MNDFFLANNRSITIKVLGNDVEVKQLQMFNFDIWSPIASVIRDRLKQSDYSDLIGAGLVKDYGAHVFQLCSMCTSTDVEMLLDLAESDPLEFSHVIKHVIEVNGAYFKEEVKPSPETRKKKGVVEQTWFDSFQFLISMGHQHSEIMEMTYGAFRSYVNAANKLYKQEIFNSAIAARVAQADKKGFESFKKEMISD